MSVKNSGTLRQLLILLAALFGARLLFVWLMPATYSYDVLNWLKVMDVLEGGGNPYRDTDVLNWPPFWMQILFGLHEISERSGISSIHLIQTTLIIGEALVISAVFLVGKRFFSEAPIFQATLFGLALNPISIFLSCQHGNYDVFVGLFVLLTASLLMEWNERGKPEAWLAACFFTGIGILSKTVPVILTPLLLLHIRRLSRPTRLFGVLLAGTPFLIGMSVLFTLEPQGVIRHVVEYRSLAGWYGITGLLTWAGWPHASVFFQEHSWILFLVLLCTTAIWAYRAGPLPVTRLLLPPLLLMMFVPTFGPGYSPPYILWFLPLLVLVYCTRNELRPLLIVGYVILCINYTVEYALFESHGKFLLQWFPSERLNKISEEASAPDGQTLIRLPMFVFYIVLFTTIFQRFQKGKIYAAVAPSRA